MGIAIAVYHTSTLCKSSMDCTGLENWTGCIFPYLFFNKLMAQFQVVLKDEENVLVVFLFQIDSRSEDDSPTATSDNLVPEVFGRSSMLSSALRALPEFMLTSLYKQLSNIHLFSVSENLYSTWDQTANLTLLGQMLHQLFAVFSSFAATKIHIELTTISRALVLNVEDSDVAVVKDDDPASLVSIKFVFFIAKRHPKELNLQIKC